MDKVIEQLNNTDKKQKKDKSVLKTIYKIYHFVAQAILYSLLIILILIAIAFAAYFIDLQKNIKNGENKQPLFGAYVIISPSMDPTIKVEDAVVIKRQNDNELKVGDIITFLSSDPRYSGLTITHRIVGIEKSKKGDVYFRTKGDNNNTEDTALVKGENIYGKVILKIPKIGYLQYILTKSYGWILLIVIPCLGVIIYDILKIFKSINKNSKLNKQDKRENLININNNHSNEKEIEVLKNNNKTDIIEDDIEVLEDGDNDENK